MNKAHKEKGDNGQSPSSYQKTLLSNSRGVVVLSALATYPIAFFLLYRIVGISAYVLTFVPVVLAGGLLGLRSGVYASFGLFFINSGLAVAIGYDFFGAIVSSIPGLIVMLLIGTILGRLHDLSEELKHEITERKKAEEGIKKYAAELEESNRLKDLFADIMSHDLLNQVSVVSGVGDIMLSESPNSRELLALRRSSNNLISLIESASKLSKLESQRELEKGSLDLKQIIDKAVEDTKHILKSAGLRVKNTVAERMPVVANPIIEDIFLNLLSNTAKYAVDGKKVVIEALVNEDSYLIAVKDYGEGIPDEAKESIFGRFTRKENAGVKGTGLGLAIAYRIVELHNGKLWVEDNPKGGSIFYVQLPKE